MTTARVLLFMVACPIALMVSAPIAARWSGLWQMFAFGLISSFAVMLISCLFARWEKIPLSAIGIRFGRTSVLNLFAGLLLGLVLLTLHTALTAAFGPVKWEWQRPVDGVEICLVSISFLLLGAREEIAYRSFPLFRLSASWGVVAAQLVVALVFAAEHVAGGYTWGGALIGTGIGSLVFGTAALATRQLALPLGLHAAWNIGDWVRSGKGAHGYLHPVIQPGHETYAQNVGAAVFVTLMLLTLLALYWWGWQRPAAPTAQRD
jgi:hypothetical protein